MHLQTVRSAGRLVGKGRSQDALSWHVFVQGEAPPQWLSDREADVGTVVERRYGASRAGSQAVASGIETETRSPLDALGKGHGPSLTHAGKDIARHAFKRALRRRDAIAIANPSFEGWLEGGFALFDVRF